MISSESDPTLKPASEDAAAPALTPITSIPLGVPSAQLASEAAAEDVHVQSELRRNRGDRLRTLLYGKPKGETSS